MNTAPGVLVLEVHYGAGPAVDAQVCEAGLEPAHPARPVRDRRVETQLHREHQDTPDHVPQGMLADTK